MCKNVIIFGVDENSYVYIDKKKKDILNYGKVPTQRLDHTTLTTEAQHSIMFSRWTRKFCLNVDYNGWISFLFVNATKIHQVKAKYSAIKKFPLCLGNISVNFSANDMEETGLNLGECVCVCVCVCVCTILL